VIDGIFQQRLEHQRRNRQIHRNRPDFPVDRKTLTETQRFELEILSAQRDFISQTHQLPGSRMAARNKSDKASSAASASCGRARIRDNTAFSELKRKCGRMRALSAASLASVWAGKRP
jgi:hypothetical protein